LNSTRDSIMRAEENVFVVGIAEQAMRASNARGIR